MNELILSITIEPLEEGGYLATSDDLQGLITPAGRLLKRSKSPICRAQADQVVRRTWQSSPPQRSPKLSDNRRNAPRPKFPSGFSFDPAPA